VVAIWVVFVSAAAVVERGVPVKVGLAFRAKPAVTQDLYAINSLVPERRYLITPLLSTQMSPVFAVVGSSPG
jgi:hypothetical protein